MAKKDKFPWLMAGGIAAGLWWLFSSPASAATAPAAAPTGLSPIGQTYMNQIMAAQSAFLGGSQTQAQYASQAAAIIARASTDTGVSSADLANLKAVAGA